MTALLHDLPRDSAERHPDAAALVMGASRTTYGELELLANRLAHQLRAAGCRPGDRVALLLPKSPLAVTGLVAALKAGAIYVPIDPTNPPARVARILSQCEPAVVLVGARTAGTLARVIEDGYAAAPFRVGWLEAEGPGAAPVPPNFSLRDVAAFPASPPAGRGDPHGPAHILFTSGSTGVPKGVVVTHASVLHFVRWANRYFGARPGDRHSGHSPLHFDLSTYDLFGSFAAGATLHLVPPELNYLPHRLAEFIRAAELTQWFSVPSVLTYLAKTDVLRAADFPALKRILWCGEVFPTPALRRWMQHVPHASFTNLYGPTEATIASSYFTVPACPADDAAPIPIGRACDGEELLVLDDDLRLPPPGVAGQLCIRGVGLSPGYWRDPARTEEVFILDPAGRGRLYRTGDTASVAVDGLLYFHGRNDTQVKSRGYRIELGEIEAALVSLPDVAECAVVAVPSDGFEGVTVCGAYVPAAGRGASPQGLRQRLAARLPSYMIPTRWQAFERLPRNANGKIDRRELVEAFAGHEAVTH